MRAFVAGELAGVFAAIPKVLRVYTGNGSVTAKTVAFHRFDAVADVLQVLKIEETKLQAKVPLLRRRNL
jgi:hypothetical protein